MSLLSRLAVQAARAYGILSSKAGVSIDYLVVAGGGGGGAASGGGGGAGGFLTSTATLSTLNTYSITVGAGGALGSYSGTRAGSSGNNSVISGTGLTTITSIGGGGAQAGSSNPSPVAQSGGSGGGGGGGSSSNTGGAGTSGQGFAGGNGDASYGGGGGGGASAAGANALSTNRNGGAGGNGSSSSISGSSVTYAGGGGGGPELVGGGSGGAGGTGGGGTGNSSGGTANTGGGGGGGNNATSPFAGYSGGSGIVIISYTSATPKFVGGTITTSGGKQIHTFTSSGTLSPITPITASYLVVAGGGGGGGATTNQGGGGGGAGGLQASSTTLYSGATYVVTVGAGGTGGVYGGAAAGSGSNSVVSGTGLTTLTSSGGGGGGVGPDANGSNGGSGGGGGSGGTLRTGGTGTSGQGNNGGQNNGSANYAAGGGGGAGAAGGDGGSVGNGNGGNGSASSISGTSVTYAGGGGAGKHVNASAAGTGGTGGGGNGGSSSVGVSGTTNLGGGGGGGSSSNVGGAGGSGIVIISYAGSQVFNGGLVTTSGGNTIHTFTSTGALTPLTNNLNNSLRFRASASAYLNRTFSTPTNNRIFTWSGWVKRGSISTSSPQNLFRTGAANSTGFRFSDTSIDGNMDGIRFFFENGTTGDLKTTQVFRDPSAWYHLVVAVDTTQATAANRVKLYINGNQITAFSTASYPAQNYIPQLNSAVAHSMGIYLTGVVEPFDGYMTDINFIDGQALEPYYFGNNDANGVWKPIQYKGTYGTNGFYLTFGNTTSTTTLGYDSSPNGNNWTCNNISLTAGTTYDAMTDVPTNTSATVANYATLNPIQTATANITWANANLQATLGTTGAWRTAINTMAVDSGKWYAEFTLTTSSGAGLSALGILPNTDNYTGSYLPGSTSGSYGYPNDGTKYNNGTNTSYGNTYTTGDIIGIAYDGTNNKIWFSKNGVWQASGDPAAGTNAAFTTNSGVSYYFGVAGVTTTQSVWNCNFGQRPFAYTPPTGFVALNTFNLPTPTILQGNKYMDATVYSGNSTSGRLITNAALFQPDFVWVKNRTLAGRNNQLFDSVRGANKGLFSNLTNAESTTTQDITAFNSNGFTVGNDNNVNSTGDNFVGWQWQAGQGTNTTNTSGSITSTVSVNTTAGFSIVTYTGTGANATVGHGLGVAPKMIIVKRRNTAAGWPVYHASYGNTGGFYLNTTAAGFSAAGFWNNTTPTSTVFSLGTDVDTNQSSSTYVAYCFAEIAGFSRFGSFTGNGSTDGPFVFTGFRPKYILIKNSSNVSNWVIFDTSRSPYNNFSADIYANISDAEYSGGINPDVLSNGFKIRTSNATWNGSGNTFIYMAFAEHPFKNSNAR